MLFVLVALFLIIIDQASKYIIRTSGGFYICNRGIAFGLPVSIIIILTLIILFLSLTYNLKFKIFNLKSISNFKFQISNFSRFQTSSLILIISGGLSNFIDRLHYGCVIDFIDLKFWPVFNLADVYITIGAIALILKVKNKK